MLLTDEHDEMLAAIRDRDVARADALAHAHTRQFRDNFIQYMKQNYLKDAEFIASGQQHELRSRPCGVRAQALCSAKAGHAINLASYQ